MNRIFVKILFLFVIFSSFVHANFNYKLEQIVSNFGIPWGMDFLDESKLLITQKDGKVFLYDLDSKKLKIISNVPKVLDFNQGGLLDIKISPNYKKDKWIYFTYSKQLNDNAVTVLSRAKFDFDNDLFYSWEELLVSKSASSKGVHFGSRITFDDNNHLFFSIGDRGIRNNAQNTKNHSGSILRLNLDGTVPFDNPFVNNKSFLPEIFSYGHRNPQGLFFDKKTNKLWSIEHGPRGGDEINLIEKGKNYGWPIISYGKEYFSSLQVGEGTHKEGMEQPKKIYIPSIAPSSLIVYSGKAFKSLKGKILASSLKMMHININTINDDFSLTNEIRIVEDINEKIRNIVESPSGLIYFSTDSGKIFVIKPKNKIIKE